MDKMQLLKRLETMLDSALATKQWGTIEITLRAGEPVVIHESRTTKLTKDWNPHDRYEQR